MLKSFWSRLKWSWCWGDLRAYLAVCGLGAIVGAFLGVWPSSSSADAQQIVNIYTPSCKSPLHTTLAMTASVALTVPTTNLAKRRFVNVCNSAENPTAGLIKCRIDGNAPVMGLGNPGDVLSNGVCTSYALDQGGLPDGGIVAVQCITGTAGMYVSTLECQ